MLICAGLTYLRPLDKIITYRHFHRAFNIGLVLTAAAWLFGQPLVLILLRDPLVLDPWHSLMIFYGAPFQQ
jgi:hypothetical protein